MWFKRQPRPMGGVSTQVTKLPQPGTNLASDLVEHYAELEAAMNAIDFPSWSAMIAFMILGLTDGPQPPPAPP